MGNMRCTLSGVLLFVSTVILTARGASLPPENEVPNDATVASTTRSTIDVTTTPSFVITTPEAAKVEEEDGENPERKPTVRTLTINSTIQYRYSVTECVSRVLNPDSKSSEVTFTLTLPESAFISNFSIEVKGKVYQAKIEEKQAAKDIYEAAVSAGQTAGHVAINPRDSSRFSVSVNVAAKEKITFRLVYEELLLRKVGTYEQKINLDPGQLVPELIVEATIEETKNFTKVRVPELRKGLLTLVGTEDKDNSLATITYLAGNRVKITYAPKLADQKKLRDNRKGISGEFIIQYDIDHDPKGELYVADGYFVHYLAPDAKHFAPLRKHVVFVIDLSGSMFGDKLQQTKDAMKVILKEMTRRDDYISIVTFSSGAKVWQPTPSETGNVTVDTDPLAPQKTTEDLLKRAALFVDSWEADGYTDIDSGLKLGFAQAQKTIPEAENEVQSIVPIVVFLTDGVPTQGELSEEKILSNTAKRNFDAKKKIHLFTLGFGRDVSFAFLKKVGLRNGGFARKIYADSDATLQLTGFFEEISHPVLMDVNITYLGDAVDKNSTARSLYKTAFDGSEMISVGKLTSPSSKITEYVIEAVSRTGPVAFNGSEAETVARADKDAGKAYTNFLERLWAYQSVRHYLDRLDAGFETDNSTELKKKALDICLEYSFVTDLTSLVVVKPEKPEKGSQVLTEKAEFADLETADVNQVVSVSKGVVAVSSVANKASFGYPGPSGLFRPASISSGYSYSARPGFHHYSASGPAFGPSSFGGPPALYGPPLQGYPTTRRPFATSLRAYDVYDPRFHPSSELSSIFSTPFTITTTTRPSSTAASVTTVGFDASSPTGSAEPESTTKTTSSSSPDDAQQSKDGLSQWVDSWLSVNPGSGRVVVEGQGYLYQNSSYFALNVTDDLSKECELKATNSTGICSSLSTCASVWQKCDLGSDPIGVMIGEFLCDTGTTKADSNDRLQGICCPATSTEAQCPQLDLK